MVKVNFLPKPLRKKGIEQKLQNACEENDIVFLAMFGSFAQAKQTKKSDIDFIVRFDKSQTKSLLDLIHTENDLKKIFKRKIDLLTEDSLSPYLKDDVLKSMRVVYEKR